MKYPTQRIVPTASAIFAPGALSLFLAGALGLLGRRRRLATRHCPAFSGER